MINIKIEKGDHVLHKPSGEIWYVLGVNYKKGKLCVAGYPPTIGNISDCVLEIKGKGVITDRELKHRNKEFGLDWS